MPERYTGMGYWEIITRQMSIVTKSQQTRFKESEIAVIGCGGLGGTIIEMLTRMGLGNLTIIDKDSFDMSNLNRQVMSSIDSIGKPKSEVTKEKIRLINPYVKVNAINEELNETNLEKIIGNCDIAIDALDNIVTRVLVSRYTKEKEISFVHGAVHGTMGQLTVFNKNTITYEELFSLPSAGKELNSKTKQEIQNISQSTPPVIGPIANIIGSLEAFEAFKIITKIGEVTLAPKILNLDLLDLSSLSCLEL
ncbi:MAG: HesA/MoeB/ThiF family protein [Methanobacteriaceae archaeon]|jgi:molybdopterin/thiamine biosynthesis adenylyltransferase|nr:HesA/MoeB/ThiF family protein [Candidatus Methanorudis spinitermitis]